MPAVNDGIVVTDRLGGYSDTILVREATALFVANLGVSVSDTVVTFDIVPTAANVQSWGGFGGAWFGASYFGDAPNVTYQQKEQVQTSGTSFISVLDRPSLADSIDVIIPLPNTFYVLSQESVTSTEAPSLLVPSLFIPATDSLSLSESVQRTLISRIVASDSTTVTGTALFDTPLDLSVAEQATLIENYQTILPFLPLTLNSVVVLHESVQLLITLKRRSRMGLMGVG